MCSIFKQFEILARRQEASNRSVSFTYMTVVSDASQQRKKIKTSRIYYTQSILICGKAQVKSSSRAYFITYVSSEMSLQRSRRLKGEGYKDLLSAHSNTRFPHYRCFLPDLAGFAGYRYKKTDKRSEFIMSETFFFCKKFLKGIGQAIW